MHEDSSTPDGVGVKLWLACFALPTYLTCMHFSNIEGGASDGGILIQEGLCVCVCVQLSSLTMQRGGGGNNTAETICSSCVTRQS